MATPERFAADFLTAAETGWKDVHSPEYDADPRATKIAQALRAAGVTQAHVLGSGSFGLAAAMQDGRVVKLTTDESEVAAGHVLLGRQLRHVAHVYGAWFVRGVHVDRWDAGTKGRVGLLITERVAPLDVKSGGGAEVTRVWKDIRRRFGASPESLALMTHAESRKILRLASKQLESELRYLADTQQDPIAHQVADALRELRANRVYSIDVHAGNIGYSHQDGVFKVFDIGSSSSPAGEKPPELPHVSRMTRGGMVEEGVEVGEIGEDVDVTARAVERVRSQPTVQAFFPDGVVVQMPLDPTARPRAQWTTRHEYPVQRVRVADLVARQQVVGREKVVEYLTNGWNEPIMVEMRGDGAALIVDGHHRAYAAYLRGDEYIDAYVVPMGQEVADEGVAEDAPGPREVPVNRLYSPRWKLEETLTEVRDGKLSRSNEQPLRLTRLDSPRGSFFILDGNHRAVEAVLAGKRTVTGIIDPEMPRIERTGGAHRDAVASKVNVVEFVRESERGGAAEDVIKLDRDAVYNGAERVVQAYARALKRVPFDKGAEAVRTWFQIEASMVEGEPTVEGASMTPFYDYPGDLKDVRGNEIEVRVMRLLVLREHNYGLIVDAFTQAVKRGRAANIWIRINLGSPEIEKLRDQPELFVPRFASIFLHELTHVRDVIKMRHVVAPEDNRLAYYNSPHEIRAYGRQIVEDVIIQARFNRDVRLAPTNEQLVERALANSQHWLQVEPWLTDENKEKIYRFVYRGLEREGLFKRSGSMRLPRTQRSRAAEDFESRADVCDDARVWYHGSPNRFDAFQARVGAPFGGDPMAVPIFLTCELATARAHAGPNGFVYTVKPTPKQIFRGQDLFLAEWPKWWPPQPDEMSSIGARLYEDLEAGRVFDDVHGEEADDALRAIARGHYDIMETGQMKQWLLDHGYDAFVVREAPRAPVSLAVMDPIRIKIVSVETYDEAWARRREVAEAPAASDAAPLPFVLVRHGHDVVPALIVDNEGDELVGVDARGRSLSFGAEDIVGLVNAEPAAVYYGVRVEAHEESMRMAAEAGQPGAKKGDVLHTYPGLKVIKGGAFKVRPRGERFQWTPEKPKGLTAFPEVKKVLMKQREGVPSLESIRMAAIFAGLTVHAGTSEAEDTFGRVVAKYKAMHGAMPPVEEIQQIIGTHLPAARLRMYETVLPWAVIVQDAMKRGLRDRELRRHIWVDIADEDQVENIGLAKMSFAFMLMGQNMCCLDSHILGGMAATKPWDPNDPQGAAIRRRDAGDRISGLWKWSPAKKGRELGLRRYEQLEDALIKGNPWHESGPLDRAQTQWQSWEFAIGIPAAHRVWLEITKELQTRQSDWDLQQVSVPF